MNPKSLSEAFQTLKRLLEARFPCRQIGAHMITFSPDDKETAFSIIESIEHSGTLTNCEISFAKIQFLDDEFKSWQRRDYLEAAPTVGTAKEEDINAEDIF